MMAPSADVSNRSRAGTCNHRHCTSQSAMAHRPWTHTRQPVYMQSHFGSHPVRRARITGPSCPHLPLVHHVARHGRSTLVEHSQEGDPDSVVAGKSLGVPHSLRHEAARSDAHGDCRVCPQSRWSASGTPIACGYPTAPPRLRHRPSLVPGQRHRDWEKTWPEAAVHSSETTLRGRMCHGHGPAWRGRDSRGGAGAGCTRVQEP